MAISNGDFKLLTFPLELTMRLLTLWSHFPRSSLRQVNRSTLGLNLAFHKFKRSLTKYTGKDVTQLGEMMSGAVW